MEKVRYLQVKTLNSGDEWIDYVKEQIGEQKLHLIAEILCGNHRVTGVRIITFEIIQREIETFKDKGKVEYSLAK